jgi:hypothetical protein
MLRTLLAAFVFVVGSGPLGCGGDDHSHATTASGDGGAIGCNADPRAQPFSAGLQRMGDAGKLTFVLVAADPAPPLRGTNAWTVKVLDAKGDAVPGATLAAEPFMPDHGHGSSSKPAATANADGTFKVAPLDLMMPGLWRVTLTAKAGDVTDAASFFFCVAG